MKNLARIPPNIATGGPVVHLVSVVTNVPVGAARGRGGRQSRTRRHGAWRAAAGSSRASSRRLRTPLPRSIASMAAARARPTRSRPVSPFPSTEKRSSRPSAKGRVERDQQDPHLGGADPPVADREAPQRVALEVDVDREHQVRDDHQRADREQHVGGEAEADPDRRGRDSVDEVIEVIVVAGALDAP